MIIDGHITHIGTLNELRSGQHALSIVVRHRTYNPGLKTFTGDVFYDVELRKQLAEHAHASLTIGDDVLIDADEHNLVAETYTDTNGDTHPILRGATARNLGISIRSQELPLAD